ncbi:MAG: hypothetical protein GF381_01440 [Candidatus Pacebacteria bacterium]|nr:hypothetical protein [Candidatus Paceibacterota bacterium]
MVENMSRRRSAHNRIKKFSDSFAHLFIPRRSNNHRPLILQPEALFYLSAFAIGLFALFNTFRFFPALKNGVLGFSSSITVEQVVNQTNQERQKIGLMPVKLSSQLSAAALAKAQDMLDHQYWAHTSPQGKEPWYFIKQQGYTYHVAGENLARDFHDTGSMVRAWMASPTHKANILNGKYQEIGIAVVNGRLEGFDTVLVVQMFGQPRQVAAAQPEVSNTGISKQFQPEVVEQRVEQAQNSEPSQSNQVEAQDNAQQTSQLEIDQQEEKTQAVAVQPQDLAQAQSAERSSVLSSAMVPIGNLSSSPLFTPLQLTKAFFLAVVLLILLTLIYDSLVIGHRKTMRLVGHNLGHIILFTSVAFLLIFFKGGVIR